MAQNKMEEVAKLLELELREEFKIKGLSERYRITNIGLQYNSETEGVWYTSNKLLPMLLQGEISIIKLPKQILDDIEREYLSNIIKPFRKNIITIKKIDYYEHEYIEIFIYRPGEIVSCEEISLPYFNKGEMYKGMEINKEYTLKELGL